MRFSVLVNDSSSRFLNGSRGLRQGDPLSLWLFILVMETLSRMLMKTVEGGFLSSFWVGSGSGDNLEIFYLHFLMIPNFHVMQVWTIYFTSDMSCNVLK